MLMALVRVRRQVRFLVHLGKLCTQVLGCSLIFKLIADDDVVLHCPGSTSRLRKARSSQETFTLTGTLETKKPKSHNRLYHHYGTVFRTSTSDPRRVILSLVP